MHSLATRKNTAHAKGRVFLHKKGEASRSSVTYVTSKWKGGILMITVTSAPSSAPSIPEESVGSEDTRAAPAGPEADT